VGLIVNLPAAHVGSDINHVAHKVHIHVVMCLAELLGLILLQLIYEVHGVTTFTGPVALPFCVLPR